MGRDTSKVTVLVYRHRHGEDVSVYATPELIRPSAYDAVALDPTTAKAFVERHHYAGSCSSSSHTFGLYERGELAGVAVFGALVSMNAHRFVFGDLGTKEAVTLGRFVLVDSVPGNGESWFIASCFAMLRERRDTPLGVGVVDDAHGRFGHRGALAGREREQLRLVGHGHTSIPMSTYASVACTMFQWVCGTSRVPSGHR